MSFDCLLGNTNGYIYTGNNDTVAAWVYVYALTTSGTVMATTSEADVLLTAPNN